MNKVAILVGSVFGAAIELAEHTEEQLKKAGIKVQLFDETPLQAVLDFTPTHWVIITSTTGMGDIPDNLISLFDEMRDSFPNLSESKYAVVGMGDSSYVDSFCGAGKQFDKLMGELMATPFIPFFEIDACETMDPVTFAEGWFEELKENILPC
ncbi:flavodoxin domain-containing protein [Algibacillus agarilyticus]|uniref:flavodoxin domain-containing protein n=1 Tax=Algibacillus agarilyticus TaxID=2234133 RepID=UPI000DD05C22|nr:flavodoxin domain-containing protein [Algibacillus agarilyticus]